MCPNSSCDSGEGQLLSLSEYPETADKQWMKNPNYFKVPVCTD